MYVLIYTILYYARGHGFLKILYAAYTIPKTFQNKSGMKGMPLLRGMSMVTL